MNNVVKISFISLMFIALMNAASISINDAHKVARKTIEKYSDSSFEDMFIYEMII